MPLWSAFIGGDSQARSSTMDAEACINLYMDTSATEENAKKAGLYGTPGLRLLMTATDTVCRGKWSADGRNFSVIGGTLYEMDLVAKTVTSRGSIANDGAPVSMVSNGRGGEQLVIVGGGQLKVLNLVTNVLSAAVALPLTNAPVMAAFVDGYFLLTEKNSIRIWFSALENGLSWNPLNFFARSHLTDNVVGIAVVQNRIWVFGSLTTEIFYDSGDALVPFIPYPSTAINYGATSAWGIVVQGDSLLWVAQCSAGPAQVMRTVGMAPQIISTPAISFALAAYSTLADVEAFVYEQEGHAFAVFTFPTADATWVFDVKELKWHQHLAWDNTLGLYHRWRARGFCASGMQLIAGDYLTGAIYAIDLETFTDNGVLIKRLRRAPYPSADNQWTFVDAFELGMQSGVGLATGQGSAPTLLLRVSRDNGNTWSPATVSTGGIGAFNGRAIWNRLGRARADRLVFEVSQTDPVRTVWGPGAWLRATPGSGQL